MHRKKKGQTTLFIVIGIVVITVVLLGIYITKSPIKNEPELYFSSAVDSIRYSIETCNKDLAEKSIVLLGLQGGRYKNVVNPIQQTDKDYGPIMLSHFSVNNNYVQFSLDDVEKEFNEYYKDNILSCLGNFDEFKTKGLNIKPKNMLLDLEFLDQSTVFTMYYEVVVSKGTKSHTLYDYPPVEIEHRFKKVFNAATESARQHASTRLIPINYVLNKDIILSTYNIGSSTIYRLVDQKNDKERRYVFYFAVN